MKLRLGKNKGSMLIASMIFATLLLHAAMEATPLFSKVKERDHRIEDGYRLWRLNEALSRYEKESGHYPRDVQELVQKRHIPRIYGSLIKNSDFLLVRNERSQIISFSN